MRHRSTFAVGLVTLLSGLAGTALLVGCEDGPSQTFTPAPANAGNLWNNGNPDASVASGPSSLDASFGSVNALQHCTSDQKRLVWANMLNQPIIPPFRLAGLNMAYDTHFSGISLQEAEAINCTGNPIDDGDIYWGNNGEVIFSYNPDNYRVSDVNLMLGYNGQMTFHQQVGPKDPTTGKCAVVSRFENSPTPDPDPTNCTGHTYVLQLGVNILKDGNVVEIDWSNTDASSVTNELFNGLMATFGQEANEYNPAGDYLTNSCVLNGACAIVNVADSVGNNGYCALYVMPLGAMAIGTNCTVGTQPLISQPTNIGIQYTLNEPYTNEDSIVQINAQGPVSIARFNNATDPAHCYIQNGMDWKTYIANCVDIPDGGAINPAFIDAGLVGGATPLSYNQINEAIAIAAPTFDYENWYFSTVGVGLGWKDGMLTLTPQDIIQDNQVPTISDSVQSWVATYDTNAWDEGFPRNDMSGTTFTGKGSAYVYREYARMVQADLNKQLAAAFPNRVTSAADGGVPTTIYNHPIGDPACAVDPATAFALGCTGMEGLAFQAPQSYLNTPTQLGDPADQCGTANAALVCNNYLAGAAFSTFDVAGYGASALRAGTFYGVWCQNPADAPYEAQPFFNNCNANILWVGSMQQVEMIAGQGNPNNLPLEIADMRYYYRWFGIAEVKYLKAYGNKASSQAVDVEAQTIDLESLFFDSYNNGAYGYADNIEYVERTFMSDKPATYDGFGTASPSEPGAVTVNATSAAAPLDVLFGGNLLGGQLQFVQYNKLLFRPENAMFEAMLANKGDLPASENNVNATNLAGSTLLQQNYASYECATQFPTVTMPVPNGSPITGSWSSVCGYACPALPNTGWCPPPPLKAAPGFAACDFVNNPTNSCTLQLDLNGENPGLGLGGTNPRLNAYPAVWGRGAACVDPNSANTPLSQLNPTEPNNNPYTGIPCGTSKTGYFANGYPVPTGVGTVFSVGQRDKAAARLSYVGADATHPLVGTNPNQLTAWVNVPDMPNPYNAITLPGDPAPTNIQATVSYTPSDSSSGFFVPISGLQNKFYQTATLGFTGYLLGYSVAVVPWQDPITMAQDGTLTVQAVLASDFLGEIFLCQDSPGTGDLLGAHMYDSAASVLTWITNHPGSEVACNMVVRYSPYDNYIDYIDSLSAGVEADINQGGGYGRVVGAVLYDPTLSSAP